MFCELANNHIEEMLHTVPMSGIYHFHLNEEKQQFTYETVCARGTEKRKEIHYDYDSIFKAYSFIRHTYAISYGHNYN